MRHELSPGRSGKRWLLIGLLAALVVIVTALAGLAIYLRSNYPPERIRQELETALGKKSGYTISVESADFTWSGNIRIRTICARNVEQKSPRCFVLAQDITLSVGLYALAQKKLDLRALKVSALTVALFEETVIGQGPAKTVIHSWDRQTTSGGLPTEPGNLPAFTIGEIDVVRGEMQRDLPFPYLPAGTTGFKFNYKGGALKEMTLSTTFSPNGKATLHLAIKTMNLLQMLLALKRDRRFLPGDEIGGDLTCERCPLGAVDSRLRFLTGKSRILASGNQITVDTEKAQLMIGYPFIAELMLSAKIPLQLPDLAIVGAHGDVTLPGLTAKFNGLNRSASGGFNGEFDFSADLAALQNSVSAAGYAAGRGRLKNSVPEATLLVKGFSMPLRQNFIITSPEFSAAYGNDTLKIPGQSFKLNGDSFTATVSLARAGGATRIRGAIKFPVLDTAKLTSPGTGAGAGTPRSAGATDVAVHLSADKLTAAPWSFENLSCDIASDASGLRIENGTLSALHGSAAFSYSRAGDGEQSLRLQTRNIRAQEISSNLALTGTVFGPLAADANLKFKGSGADEIRRTLSGSLNANLGRGKIKNSFLQKGVLSGPLHKLEDKFSDIEFASGSVDARFTTGAVQIKRLYFDAEEWNVALRAEGDHLGQGKAALNFRFRSSFVENAANPLHLGINARKEGDFYDLPFACRGNFFSGACYKPNW